MHAESLITELVFIVLFFKVYERTKKGYRGKWHQFEVRVHKFNYIISFWVGKYCVASMEVQVIGAFATSCLTSSWQDQRLLALHWRLPCSTFYTFPQSKKSFKLKLTKVCDKSEKKYICSLFKLSYNLVVGTSRPVIGSDRENLPYLEAFLTEVQVKYIYCWHNKGVWKTLKSNDFSVIQWLHHLPFNIPHYKTPSSGESSFPKVPS
jgi:hypothetical protein